MTSVLKIRHFQEMSISASLFCDMEVQMEENNQLALPLFKLELAYIPFFCFFCPSCPEWFLSILISLFLFVQEVMGTVSFSLICELCCLLPSFLHFLLFLNTVVILMAYYFYEDRLFRISSHSCASSKFCSHVPYQPMIASSGMSQIKELTC